MSFQNPFQQALLLYGGGGGGGGFQGPIGVQGLQGSSSGGGGGSQGPQGVVGVQGIIGRQGAVGSGTQGVQGDVGNAGAAGVQGVQGLVGPTGGGGGSSSGIVATQYNTVNYNLDGSLQATQVFSSFDIPTTANTGDLFVFEGAAYFNGDILSGFSGQIDIQLGATTPISFGVSVDTGNLRAFTWRVTLCVISTTSQKLTVEYFSANQYELSTFGPNYVNTLDAGQSRISFGQPTSVNLASSQTIAIAITIGDTQQASVERRWAVLYKL